MDINQIISDISFISSEVILLVVGILSLIYGLFNQQKTKHVQIILILGIITSLAYIHVPISEPKFIFNESIISDEVTRIFRLLILLSSLICMLFMFGKKMQFEIPVLIVLSTAALMLFVASNDLMTMYLTMELSAIGMYICISSDLNKYSSTEAGLKYFILGSVASCIFLLGTSIISGFTGPFSFKNIGDYIIDTVNGDFVPILFVFSAVMIMCVFFFKMSAAPFHTWIPDVYNGSPWYVSLFLGSASKIAIAGLLIKCTYSLFNNLSVYMQHFLTVVSVLSMFIGSVGAIMQQDLRRILAYSSVGNMGFALAAMSTTSLNGMTSGFIYIVLYSVIMFIPTFALIGLLKTNDKDSLVLNDLHRLSISHPYKTAMLALLMLSIAGLPPFAGFFGKFYILMNLIAHNMAELSILFIIAAVLSSFYCIKIIKNIYFSRKDLGDEVLVSNTKNVISLDMMIISLLCFMNILYCVYSSQVISFCIDLFRSFI